MRLLNGARAVVPKSKITEYLLSRSHPDGRSKAEYLARFGFRLESWTILQEALLQHADSSEVVQEAGSEYGTRYVLEGPLRTPDGRNPVHRTVWIVETGSTVPQLITAYPARRRNA
jgi:hypothetical protein